MIDSKNKPVRLAVVGMGYWGKNLVRNFHQLGSLAAVCDPNPAIETVLSEDYVGVRYLRDFSNLLADDSIQAVAIATPAVSHYQMAMEALRAGKDVFVEKPLAVDVKQGRELLEYAETNGRILMVGHILQYHPAVLKLRELIANGSLGKLSYIYSNRLNIGKIRTEENILWSFAPHDMSVMLSLVNETPRRVSSHGGASLNRDIYDVTVSHFEFPSGVQGHIFVSWLHPVKEQKLVVVGSEQMAVFDDTCENKLVLYPHKVEWKNQIPTALKAEGEVVPLDKLEPLRAECQHFIDRINDRQSPRTDGAEGLRVLSLLDACQRALLSGKSVEISVASARPYFVHETAVVDEGAEIGRDTKIWHFSHVLNGARIGERCVLGQNVNVDKGTVIGNNVKIQNNVSIYGGIVVEDDVFLGPSCVLTNVTNPRSQVNRHSLYEKTVLKRGCTIGANATIVCGVTLGRYSFIAAGAVVTKSVPDYALMVGNPARQIGWMSRHGHRLQSSDESGAFICPESKFRYRLDAAANKLVCLDLDEEKPLPPELSKGERGYKEFKSEHV